MCWLQGEPSLEDVLSEPIVMALMERDRVNSDDFILFLENVRRAQKGEAGHPRELLPRIVGVRTGSLTRAMRARGGLWGSTMTTRDRGPKVNLLRIYWP